MMTVSEVSRLTGVSIRTLQYYDKIGLLHPSGHTEAGYRLYDDTALAALQQILLFREMEFPLKDIRQIMTQPGFDREKALTQQMELLTLKKQRLENLIDLARRMQQTGGKPMDFTAFDTTKLEEYARQAKQAWGTTPEYQEFEGKSAKRTPTRKQYNQCPVDGHCGGVWYPANPPSPGPGGAGTGENTEGFHHPALLHLQ